MSVFGKVGTKVGSLAKIIYVINKTGEYNSPDNLGGFGDPNDELSELAILGYAQRINYDSTVTELVPITEVLQYDNTANNTDETTFQFTHVEDGHINVGFFILEVTLDQVTYVGSGAALANNDYYYYNGAVYYRDPVDGDVIIEDYSVMLNVDNVNQAFCEHFIFPLLTIKLGEYYRQYRLLRNSNCIREANEVKEKRDSLRGDLQGAYYLYKSGLLAQAREEIRALINEHL